MNTIDMIIDLESKKVSFESHLSGALRGDEHAGRIMSYEIPAKAKRNAAKIFVADLFEKHDIKFSCNWDGSNWRGTCGDQDALYAITEALNARTYHKEW